MTQQVVSSLSGDEKPIPPLTAERKAESDNRMSRLVSHSARRGTLAPPHAERTATPTPSDKPKEPQKKAEEASPQESKKVSETQKGTSPEKKEEKPDNTDWKARASQHQSRADAAEERIKKHLEPLESRLKESNISLEQLSEHDIIPRAQHEEYKKSKKYVEAFVEDPVGFIMQYQPDLASKLASAGDPIRLIEAEVSKFQVELDKAFKKELGSDWRFSEVDAMKPGTPSFRYKLALEDNMESIRRQRREYAEGQRRKLDEARQQEAKDKERVKQEFGFTDEELAEGEKWLGENKPSYYWWMRVALFDKILERKLGTIVHPETPPPDAGTGGGDHPRPEKKKTELSDRGKQLARTLGPNAFAKGR